MKLTQPYGCILDYDRPSLPAECLSLSCVSGFLYIRFFVYQFILIFPLGIQDRVGPNQSLKELLSYQHNFEYTQCHLKFWIRPSYFVGGSVLYKHQLYGKAILDESEVISLYGGAQSIFLLVLL